MYFYFLQQRRGYVIGVVGLSAKLRKTLKTNLAEIFRVN